MNELKASQFAIVSAIAVALLLGWSATVPAQMTGLDSTQLIGGCDGCENTTSGGLCDLDGSEHDCYNYKNKAIGTGSGTVQYITYCVMIPGCEETEGTYCD